MNMKTNKSLESRASALIEDLKADPVNAAFIMAFLEDTLWRIAQGVEYPEALAKRAFSDMGRDFDKEQAEGNAIAQGKDPGSFPDVFGKTLA